MREFTVGGVLRRVAALFRTAPWLLLALALVFVVIPYGLAMAAVTVLKPAKAGWGSLTFVLYWLGSLLLQAATIRVALDAGDGRTLRFGAAAGTAARFFLPVLAVSVLAGIATGLASILLVFPGVMLICRFFVANQAAVAEGSGVFGAFGRSAVLTDGVRWRVLGIILVMSVINFVGLLVPALLGGLATGALHSPWPAIVGSTLGSGLSMLVAAVFYAATYLELREIREGLSSEALVSVFG